jgi:hypothetical protein
MSAKRNKLPSRLPIGAKYVLEYGGTMQSSILVNRFVELPNGRRVELAARMVPTCGSEWVAPRVRSRAKKLIRPKALA